MVHGFSGNAVCRRGICRGICSAVMGSSAVVGKVIFHYAVRVGGIVAAHVLGAAVRAGAEVVVGVVDAGGIDYIVARRIRCAVVGKIVGVGRAVHRIKGICRIHGSIGGVHSVHGVYAVESVQGLYKRHEEKNDEKRRHPHDGHGPFQGIMIMVEPQHDEMETQGDQEGYDGGMQGADGEKITEKKAVGQIHIHMKAEESGHAVHIKPRQHRPPVLDNVAQPGKENNEHKDKGHGCQKGKKGNQGKSDDRRHKDGEDPLPGVKDKEADNKSDGKSLVLRPYKVDEHVEKSDHHENQMGGSKAGIGISGC